MNHVASLTGVTSDRVLLLDCVCAVLPRSNAGHYRQDRLAHAEHSADYSRREPRGGRQHLHWPGTQLLLFMA